MIFFNRAEQIGFSIPTLSGFDIPLAHRKCLLLDGRVLSEKMLTQAQHLVQSHKIVPCLAVVLVGDDPASQVYVKRKIQVFQKAGFQSKNYTLPERGTTEEDLLSLVAKLNQDQSVHGVLLQLPLPKRFSATKILSAISPHKDVDGFSLIHMGSLASGTSQGFLPCTPFGIMVLLSMIGCRLEGLHAVVVGRSNIVGRPMALLLLNANATVTIAHSQTHNLQDVCRSADILVVAAGRPHLVDSRFVKPGAVVIDVGIHRLANGSLCGDVNTEDVKSVAGVVTPVPGGVGPMTIAMLLVNTALAAWSSKSHFSV